MSKIIRTRAIVGNEESEHPKHKINTRWHLKHNAPVARYSAERPKIEATYWSRANRRNKWKLVSESLDEFEYIFEFAHKKFRDGFYAGARVGNTVSTTERINNLANGLQWVREARRYRYHAHELVGTLRNVA
jgi:hypothetical protein